jgi:hypothetical protein
MLQWLVSLKTDWLDYDIESICAAAAAVNSIDKLDWLATRFPREHILDFTVAYSSSRAGALQSLQWPVAAGFSFDDECYTEAASLHRQLPVLQYLIDVAHCPWDPVAVREAAAKTGAHVILQWLVERDGAVWSTATLSHLLNIAGQHGHLAAAQWLRTQGAEWPSRLLCHQPDFPHAASKYRYWSLNTMQLARANGCPWGRWPSERCAQLCIQERQYCRQRRGYSLFWTPVRKDMQDLRCDVLWAHAVGCPCNSSLHSRATEHLRARKRVQLFRLGFCICWRSVAERAVTCAFVLVVYSKLHALARVYITDDDVARDMMCIMLTFLCFALLFLMVSLTLEELLLPE